MSPLLQKNALGQKSRQSQRPGHIRIELPTEQGLTLTELELGLPPEHFFGYTEMCFVAPPLVGEGARGPSQTASGVATNAFWRAIPENTQADLHG